MQKNMNEEQVQITQELIQAGESGAGGWNQAQLELLGVKWPLQHGWRRRIEGSLIPKADAEKFIRLRGVTKKHQRKFQNLMADFETLDSSSELRQS